VFDPKKELRKWSTSEIVSKLRQIDDLQMVVITGGEPLLQAKSLGPLVESLKNIGLRVEFETNGTLSPEHMYMWWTVDQWNISPKLSNSKNTVLERYKPEVWQWYLQNVGQKAVFKFVISDLVDLDEVRRLVASNNIPKSQVWIMPEGCSQNVIGKRLEDVAQKVLDLGWNLTSRLQVTIWKDKRGV
jgi:7-carboxy-7-deazaguanine synthase